MKKWTSSGDATVVPDGARSFDTGYVQQRLTLQGVQLLRSKILATGLFAFDFAGLRLPHPSYLHLSLPFQTIAADPGLQVRPWPCSARGRGRTSPKPLPERGVSSPGSGRTGSACRS